MSLKPGRTLYRACAYEPPTGGAYDTGHVELEEWKVRTVRGGRVTAICHIHGTTWVKKSRKHKDWGWAAVIDPLYRKTWNAKDPLPDGLSLTKAAAYRKELETLHKGFITDHPEVQAWLASRLKSGLTRSLPGKQPTTEPTP